MRLIDADRLLVDLPKLCRSINNSNNCRTCPLFDTDDDMCKVEDFIHSQPDANIFSTTNVVERKKGQWIKMPEFRGDDVSGFIDNHFSCSECKKEAEINSWGFYILSDFCPHCGAEMKGNENG